MQENAIHTILTTSESPYLFQIAKIARLAISNPSLLLDVLDGLRSKDFRMAMSCAEAIEKVSRLRPELLTGYETEILTNLSISPFAEVRGPLALVMSRLSLTDSMKTTAVTRMLAMLDDESTLLKERVYNALAHVSREDANVMEKVVPLLQTRLEAQDPIERTKAKNLLAEISGTRKISVPRA